MDNYPLVSKATVIEMYKKSQQLSIFAFKKKFLKNDSKNNFKNDLEKTLLKQFTQNMHG